MKKYLITAAFTLAATAALAQSAAESSGVNSLVGAAPSTADFVTQASASDLYEIESSKLALQKGDDATKTFAQQMITDHQKTSEELKGLVSTGKVEAKPAAAMPDDLKQKVDDLSALQGADFIEQYVDDQVEVHEDAVDLFRRYAEGGDNAELKAWAAKTLPALEHHYQMVQEMDGK